jgi:hypothetical protein
VAKKKLKIRKPKNGKGWRDWFSWAKRSQTRSSRVEEKEKLSRRLKIAAMSIFLPLLPAGLVVGFFYMEKYVNAQQVDKPKYGKLEFVNIPAWAHSEAMIKRLTEVAGKEPFELKAGMAKTVYEKLSPLDWLLYDIQIRTTTQNVMVYAKYRQPQAIIKSSKGQPFHVALIEPDDPLFNADKALVVLEAVEVEKLPMPEITGVVEKEIPSLGKKWRAPDVLAALELLSKLKEMDDKICPKKPLRAEIASIDITNFEGRRVGATSSHIILRLKDGTPVNWGAALGKAASFFEAPDDEKLTLLYTFYQEHKYTLLGQAKTIELFQPKSGIPRPQ